MKIEIEKADNGYTLKWKDDGSVSSEAAKVLLKQYGNFMDRMGKETGDPILDKVKEENGELPKVDFSEIIDNLGKKNYSGFTLVTDQKQLMEKLVEILNPVELDFASLFKGTSQE